MQIDYFLKERTKFIRYFYERATEPFISIINAIEQEKEPYVQSGREDSVPEFQEEWEDASLGMDTVGQTALSMLSSSVKLFLSEWRNRVKKRHGIDCPKNFEQKGWLCFFKEIQRPINECPAKLEIIEQVILARNRIQHPGDIIMLKVRHCENDLKKYPRPFFADEHELKPPSEKNENFKFWDLAPSVATTKESIFIAISEVESFCSWLEEEYWNAIKSQRRLGLNTLSDHNHHNMRLLKPY